MASAATIGFNGDCIGAVTPGPTTLYGHEKSFDSIARIADNLHTSGSYPLGPVMKKTVWVLLTVAVVSWGICYLYPTDIIHFGWGGTLFASIAGLIATMSSYRTEAEVATRYGGTIYKAESPIRFLMAYVLVGLLLAAFAFISILGWLGRLGQ